MNKYSSFGDGLLSGMKTVSDIQNQSERTAIARAGQESRDRYYDAAIKQDQANAEFERLKYDRQQQLDENQRNFDMALRMMPGEYDRVARNGGEFSPEFYRYAKGTYLDPSLYLREGVHDAINGLMGMTQSGDYSNQAQAAEWLNTVFGHQLGEGKTIAGMKRGPNGGLVLELNVDGNPEVQPLTLLRSSHPNDNVLEMDPEAAMRHLMTMGALSQAVNREDYRGRFQAGIAPHLYTEQYRKPIIQAHNQQVREYQNIRSGLTKEIDKWQKEYLKDGGAVGDERWEQMAGQYKAQFAALDEEYGKKFAHTMKRHSYLVDLGEISSPLSTRARSVGNAANNPNQSGTGTNNAGSAPGGAPGGTRVVDTGDLGISSEAMAGYEQAATNPFLKAMGDAVEGGIRNAKGVGQFAMDYHPMGMLAQWVNRKVAGTPEEQAARAEIQKLLRVVQNRSLPEAERLQAKQQIEMVMGNLQQQQAIAEQRQRGIPARPILSGKYSEKGLY